MDAAPPKLQYKELNSPERKVIRSVTNSLDSDSRIGNSDLAETQKQAKQSQGTCAICVMMCFVAIHKLQFS